MNGASLIAKNLPLQDQFNVIEDLMLAFCEKVALPCFLCRDANPDLYAYLGYLKTQVEAKPCEEDFETIRVMGKGGFGLVKGCKTLRTGKMYALKEMDLKHVTKKKAKVLCDAEHACLIHPVVAESPFIVSLIYAFQSSSALCLVLDLMTGGDLSFHLDRAPSRRFPEEAARYYAARTLLGLEALHDAGFVYRDLKPENILVDGDGRCRLSDLGLAALVPQKGVAGTPGYLSPEMLQGHKYGTEVDWWSFGCLLYELVSGTSPFRTQEARKIYAGDAVASANKATLEMSVEYPPYFSGELKDSLSQLLQKDPEKRLVKNVAGHAFFSSLDWSILRNDPDPDTIEGSQEAPPFQPGNSLNVEDPDEIGTFPNLPDIVVDPGMFPEASWLYVSETKYQEEVVWLLQYQEKVQPKKSSSFCTIA